jgi:hypothetical protein
VRCRDYNRDSFLDLFGSTYLNFDLKTVSLPGATENCTSKSIAVNCGPRGQSDLRLHFGLGTAASSIVEIHWPSGLTEASRDVTLNQILSPKEGNS